MKNGWKQMALGEILHLEYGKSLDERDRKPNGRFPVYGANGEKDRTDRFYHEKQSIIVGRKGSAGEINLTEKKFWPLDVTYFVTFDDKQHDLRFLYYLLTTMDLPKLAKGVKPGINRNEVYSQVARVPALPEQQRIVGILDKAFDGIATAKANAEKNLQNAHSLFESHLQSVFTQRGKGWREIQLADVCERLHQGLNTAGEKVKFYDSGFPIIQTRNIDDGVVELDSKIKFMCEEDWHVYKDKYRPEVGDVFFTNIGTIGKTAIVTVDRDYLIHWNIFKLRPRIEKITSEFLRYTLEQLTSSGYFEKLQKGGTVDFVTKKMISEALIYLPNKTEQEQIVAKLDSMREETQHLESIYRQKLDALETLKKSLLHQAFSGNL
ncbi:MAG TPA: restriction endonuclease subunit S [Terriglobales bacterium]|jgi:type I restriction enzyme S subunit|nr:restriction endonuclease subunit S [Terriglobales bacterium]